MFKHFFFVEDKYYFLASDDISILGELVESAVKGGASNVESVRQIGHGNGELYGFLFKGSQIKRETTLGGAGGEIHDLFIKETNAFSHEFNVIVHNVFVVFEHLGERRLGNEEHARATLCDYF